MNRIQGELPSNSKYEWWEGDDDGTSLFLPASEAQSNAKAPVDRGGELNMSSLGCMRAALQRPSAGLSHRDHLWKDGEE